MADGASARVDREGRLVAADPRVRALEEAAGGGIGLPIAVPQLAVLVRLAQSTGALIARNVLAAQGDRDLELFVRAQPDGDDVAVDIAGWVDRRARPIEEDGAHVSVIDTDFLRELGETLRAPLARIVAKAEELNAPGTIPERYLAHAEDIRAAARHLAALVEDLDDPGAVLRGFAEVPTSVVDLASIARAASNMLAVAAGKKSVGIVRPAANAVLDVVGNAARITQILANLIANAVRHAPEGSRIAVQLARDKERALVIVSDEGRGIAAGDQARIFEKFVQLDPASGTGSGLGLYIARRLARAMGGDILVDSAPDRGAHFVLTLPLAKDA